MNMRTISRQRKTRVAPFWGLWVLLLCVNALAEEIPLTARFYVSPSGNDLMDGLSWETAKATPQGAVDALLSMSTPAIVQRYEIWLREDTYRYQAAGAVKSDFIVDINEGVNVRFFGGFSGSEHYLEERSWTRHPVIFDGEGVYSGFSMVRTLPSPPDPGRKYLLNFNGEEVLFDGIQFRRMQKGVEAEGILYFSFNHCTFQQCQYAFWGNSGESMRCGMGNTLMDTCGSGIVIDGLHGTINLQNCTISNLNSEYSFRVGLGDRILATNTVFWNCSPLYSYEAVFRNSCFSESLFTGSFPFPEYMDIADCIQEEPEFVDAAGGNYQLRPDSPCVNTGTVPSLALPDDLLGVARPQGGLYDMGAYEYSAGCMESGCHGSDQNHDGVIQLGEVLRVIQFFNSQGLHCAETPASTEDGYVPGLGANHACMPHSSDYNPQDWSINLSELLRLIQLYNSSGYHLCAGSEDGFCAR